MIKNQDRYSQFENDEKPEAEYPNESDVEDGETNKTSALPNFMQQISPNAEIAEWISSLNSKQKEIFHVVHAWAKYYVKYDKQAERHWFFRKKTSKKVLVRHDKNYYHFCKSNIPVINLIVCSRNMIKKYEFVKN